MGRRLRLGASRKWLASTVMRYVNLYHLFANNSKTGKDQISHHSYIPRPHQRPTVHRSESALQPHAQSSSSFRSNSPSKPILSRAAPSRDRAQRLSSTPYITARSEGNRAAGVYRGGEWNWAESHKMGSGCAPGNQSQLRVSRSTKKNEKKKLLPGPGPRVFRGRSPICPRFAPRAGFPVVASFDADLLPHGRLASRLSALCWLYTYRASVPMVSTVSV